jgi:hypothetical protein
VTNTFGWMGDLAMVVPGVDEADEADEVLQGVGDAAYDASSADTSYSTEPVTTSGRIEGAPEPWANYREASREPEQMPENVENNPMEAEAMVQAVIDHAAELRNMVNAAQNQAFDVIDQELPTLQDPVQREAQRSLMNGVILQRRLWIRQNNLDAAQRIATWQYTTAQIRAHFARIRANPAGSQ